MFFRFVEERRPRGIEEIIEEAVRLHRPLVGNEGPRPRSRRLSAIERLPDEILVMMMGDLDFRSLHFLSGITDLFQRLSQDRMIQGNLCWGTFRYSALHMWYVNDGETRIEVRPLWRATAEDFKKDDEGGNESDG
ncbi:hypothetical protein F4802DRAFT_602088 [Xylaria palmicola]|nr:hypothetical protein F4802DRAFT_602088 [Xylaria palmicola]